MQLLSQKIDRWEYRRAGSGGQTWVWVLVWPFVHHITSCFWTLASSPIRTLTEKELTPPLRVAVKKTLQNGEALC